MWMSSRALFGVCCSYWTLCHLTGRHFWECWSSGRRAEVQAGGEGGGQRLGGTGKAEGGGDRG